MSNQQFVQVSLCVQTNNHCYMCLVDIITNIFSITIFSDVDTELALIQPQ